MRRPKASLATTMISPASFHGSAHDGTRLDWFTYQLALAVFNQSFQLARDPLQRQGYGGDALAEFSVHAAEDLRGQILMRLSGELDAVVLSYELVREHLRTLDDATTDRIVDAMMNAWDGVLGYCECCPTACITNRAQRSDMFDGGEAEEGCPARPRVHRVRAPRSDRILEHAVTVKLPGADPAREVDARGYLERLRKWSLAFKRSPEHAHLAPEQQEATDLVLATFLWVMTTEMGRPPEEWDQEAVGECCLRVLPEKVVSVPELFQGFAPVLAAFLAFAGRKRLIKGGRELSEMVATFEGRIVADASDPERWEGAKAEAMASPDDTMGFSDEERVGRRRARYGAGPRDAGKGRKGGPNS